MCLPVEDEIFLLSAADGSGSPRFGCSGGGINEWQGEAEMDGCAVRRLKAAFVI